MIRKAVCALLVLSAMCMASVAVARTPEQEVMYRWEKEELRLDSGTRLEMVVTYYSAEYIEAMVKSEADKNLWTNDEMENYKYNLLKSLNIADSIAFRVDMNNVGDSLHMAPFDRQVKLEINGKTYKPSSYDPRFNFRLQGKISGMVFFPRFDDKNKDITVGASKAKFTITSALGLVMRGNDATFFWDINRDNPEKLYKGMAADRLEKDRLIRRLEMLNKEKRELEGKLEGINTELGTINKRMDEIK